MIKLKIKITKDILRRSMYCGQKEVITNCAIALAIRDVFPDAIVGGFMIGFETSAYSIFLPTEAQRFTKRFDMLAYSPKKRLQLTEFEFEIEVPNEIIESINIEEVRKILQNHPNLELV